MKRTRFNRKIHGYVKKILTTHFENEPENKGFNPGFKAQMSLRTKVHQTSNDVLFLSQRV